MLGFLRIFSKAGPRTKGLIQDTFYRFVFVNTVRAMRKPDWLKVEDPDTENHRWEGLQSLRYAGFSYRDDQP